MRVYALNLVSSYQITTKLLCVCYNRIVGTSLVHKVMSHHNKGNEMTQGKIRK